MTRGDVVWYGKRAKRTKKRFVAQQRILFLVWSKLAEFDKYEDAIKYSEEAETVGFVMRIKDRHPELMRENTPMPKVGPKGGSGGSHAGKPPRGGSGVSRPVSGGLADGLRKGLGDA